MADNNQTDPLSDEACRAWLDTLDSVSSMQIWQEATRRARAEISDLEKDHELCQGDLMAHIEDLTKSGQYLQKEVEQQEADNKRLQKLLQTIAETPDNDLRFSVKRFKREARAALEGKE